MSSRYRGARTESGKGGANYSGTAAAPARNVWGAGVIKVVGTGQGSGTNTGARSFVRSSRRGRVVRRGGGRTGGGDDATRNNALDEAGTGVWCDKIATRLQCPEMEVEMHAGRRLYERRK